MTIVKLTQKDLDAIVELYQEDFSDGWNKNMLESSFKGGRFVCFGAFLDERLVGVIALTVGTFDADIEGVVTRSKFRRKGIADALINSAIEYAKSLKLEKVLLEVRATNISAIQLYLKHGFEKISVRKKYYSDGEDAFIFIKEI